MNELNNVAWLLHDSLQCTRYTAGTIIACWIFADNGYVIHSNGHIEEFISQ